MKKGLIITLSIFLALVLLAAGFFFWKGGHHALALAGIAEQWLDADVADQALTVQLQIPGFRKNAETGRVEPQVQQLTLTADSFWTEYADRRILGLSMLDATAYLDGRILYMDTGKAYSLPQASGTDELTRDLVLGMLLYGRVTRTDDGYRIRMDTGKLELDVTVSADRALRGMTVSAVLADGTAANLFLTVKEPLPHPIPQEITDAMVRSQMEPPMVLTEPLEVLLPAVETLLPLQGEMSLGVECGILELEETVLLRMDAQKAELERKGSVVSVDLPTELTGAEPAVLGLLLLRNGTLIREDTSARFEINLPPQITNELGASLVPQIEELGIVFTESQATLTITDSRLTAVSLTAQGEVPFLFTTIPVSFQAQLAIQ